MIRARLGSDSNLSNMCFDSSVPVSEEGLGQPAMADMDFNSGAAIPAGAEIARGSLWILHSCLERLERRDGSQVSFFSHSCSRRGLLPVINLSMIDAPCLTGRRCWRFWATTSVENSGNLREVDS